MSSIKGPVYAVEPGLANPLADPNALKLMNYSPSRTERGAECSDTDNAAFRKETRGSCIRASGKGEEDGH